MREDHVLSRRRLLGAAAAAGLAGIVPGGVRAEASLAKPIPATGERIPAIGMGSWITFNVGDDPEARAQRVEVLRAFFEAGGGMIDSSPMYGSSEEVIGHCLGRLGSTPAHPEPGLFSATKLWHPLQSGGASQAEDSFRLWGLERFDLLQVHNLVSWEAHLETLQELRAAGRVRYIGVTTSHGSRHERLEEIMASQPIDFVQLTYNAVDRAAERRLLPLAAERGLAVIVNRPFRRGVLIDRVERHPLPAWAGEIDCANWAQFLLKFIVSHPAVTCAIPATSRVDHMRENMGARLGAMPDAETRARMAREVEAVA